MQWNVEDRTQMAELRNALLACPQEIQETILKDFFRQYGTDVREQTLRSLMKSAEPLPAGEREVQTLWLRLVDLVFRGGRQPFALHVDRLTKVAKRNGWVAP